jgi:diguanylate cyclase (GGDEF)-like protein
MQRDARKLEDAIQRLRTAGGTAEFEMVHTYTDETAVNLQVTVSPLEFYNPPAVLCVSRDISDRKALEAQLSHQAFHDPLTGLANRALFKDRVEHAFARAVRNARPVIVLFLDLDNFKKINDSLGHDAGDQLLVEVARRILACVRINDTVARLGGDEFAVLLDGASIEDSVRVAERILKDLPISYTIEDREVVVGTSIGIGIADSGTGSNAEDLLRNADAVMSTAKGSGMGRHAVFESDMHTQAVDQLDLEVGLRRALQRAEFTLHYQPIVDLRTGQLAGFEALVRWNHPERGLLAPDAFIPLAEETGLIVALGRWVLREACMRVRQWQVRYSTESPLTINVNVSGRQITEPNFVEVVEAALGESGLAAENLVLEITESVVIERTGPVLGRLQRLRDIGVQIAIDDFGTGYSSLSAIHTLPVDVLKIDRSFVTGIERKGGDREVLRTILNLGKTLGLCTVAEGIETEHQWLQLQSLGCPLGQGFYLGRPVSSPEVVTLLYESMSELPLTA